MITLLWLVVVGVAGAGAGVHLIRRARLTRSAADAHRRVLTTLDAITSHTGEHPMRERESDEAHQHVRLVRTEALDRDLGRTAPRRGRSLGPGPARVPVALPALTGRLSPPEDSRPGTKTGSVEQITRSDSPAAPAPDPSPVALTEVDPPGLAAPTLSTHEAGPQRPADGASAGPATPAPGVGLQALVRSSRPKPPARRVTGAPGRSVVGHRVARRRRALRSVAATAVAAGFVVAVVVVIAGRGGAPASHRSAARTETAVTAPPSSAAPPLTTTTVPRSAATLVSSGPQLAVYSLAGPATITLRASTGVSWAQLRQGDQSGAVVYEGSLAPGQAETITGPAWMRLGNPTAVTVAVNGATITAPALAAGQPYDLQFR